MVWLKDLAGAVVGLDTAPLIYFIEKNPTYTGILNPFFEALDRGEFRVVTSTLTISEVLVHPFRNGNSALAQQYAQILLNSRNLTVLPVSDAIAVEGARMRALHGLRTPDAIQIAAALAGNATSFLTNDKGLSSIPGLNVLLLDRLLTRP